MRDSLVHAALLVLILLPIILIGRRGGIGARSATERVRARLGSDGHVSVPAQFLARLFGTGPIELDRSCFTVNGWSRQTYAWVEVLRPFHVVRDMRGTSVAFHILKRKKRRRIRFLAPRASGDAAFYEAQVILPSCYKIGAEKLVELMNELRNAALALQVS